MRFDGPRRPPGPPPPCQAALSQDRLDGELAPETGCRGAATIGTTSYYQTTFTTAMPESAYSAKIAARPFPTTRAVHTHAGSHIPVVVLIQQRSELQLRLLLAQHQHLSCIILLNGTRLGEMSAALRGTRNVARMLPS